jgi:hypothetical protein
VKARRITEITTQTDEAFIIRRRASSREGGSTPVWCAQCGPGVPMITPEEGAILFWIGVRAIYREIETGRLHFQDAPAGSLLVCLGSLQEAGSSLYQSSSSQIQNNKEIPS